MNLLISSDNVLSYLVRQDLISPAPKNDDATIEIRQGKNFNLLVTLADGSKLLVKQERYNQQGKTAGEFLNEWRSHEFWRTFPELGYFAPWLPQLLDFDSDNSILVSRYLDNYLDLFQFYANERRFPSQIAKQIGIIISQIHRQTFRKKPYQQFFQEYRENSDFFGKNFIKSLQRIGPNIFGDVPGDGIKFYQLYQRYDSLQQAVDGLGSAFTPTCLTHNDLKLNNILLHRDWGQSPASIILLIDWERSQWGDPAFDLGTLIASYMEIWLSSLVVSKTLSIEASLLLAGTPLEELQPSLAALSESYFDNFPEIVEYRHDFWQRVVQFAGLALLQRIQATIQYQKSFGNPEICIMQVAKTLLCRPELSMQTVLGLAPDDLNRIGAKVA
ncbi:phosphotransferase [[Phormidium] sp. ETS-05]|uniref:phosphotransferase n=1 Tax=[Phormidium] sp. ETS-05 TaxID=222819 RepID=UPI0018EED8D8|nr:phosphotransferase [[Phormidium] sp. ETS-05]